jgi:hypothetical protein
MGHGLFIVGTVSRQFFSDAKQGFANSNHIAMAEDRPDTGKYRQFLAVNDGHLAGQEFHQGLRSRQADCLAHGAAPYRIWPSPKLRGMGEGELGM